MQNEKYGNGLTYNLCLFYIFFSFLKGKPYVRSDRVKANLVYYVRNPGSIIWLLYFTDCEIYFIMSFE